MTKHHDPKALYYAVQKGDYRTAQYLITQLHLDLNIQDANGITLLMIAAKNGDIPMLKLLLQHGANPSTTDHLGRTALHYAVKNRHAHIAQYLLTQFQLDPNIQDDDGITPFMIAAQNGDVKMLQRLIQHGANPHITNRYGESALHYAVEKKQYDTVEYLITQLHLDPNIQDNDRITPFLLAAENGDIPMFKLLLQHGADPYTADRYDQNALHYSVKNRHDMAVQYLLTYLGFDPNAKDALGQTPFLLAAENGDIPILQRLIQHGANPSTTDHQGRTAIHYATENYKRDTVQYLITQFRLNPNIQNGLGQTPSFIAAKNLDIKMLTGLNQLGAHPNIPNHQGQKPTTIIQQYRLPLGQLRPSIITL